MYTLITHTKPGGFTDTPLVWYIGLTEKGVAKPIPENEASKICDLLNAIMQIPEENLKSLLDNIRKVKGGDI